MHQITICALTFYRRVSVQCFQRVVVMNSILEKLHDLFQKLIAMTTLLNKYIYVPN